MIGGAGALTVKGKLYLVPVCAHKALWLWQGDGNLYRRVKIM